MAVLTYISAAELKAAAQESDSSGPDSWEALAVAVSRVFDRECEVPDNFFGKAAAAASVKSFLGSGTEYIKLFPYIANSIAAITVAGTALTVPTVTSEYAENDEYLIFAYLVVKNAAVSVSARWGFSEIPADIKQACIEQALFQWRRKDLAFADLSGVSAAAVNSPFSPTFQGAVNRYRGIYSRNLFFA